MDEISERIVLIIKEACGGNRSEFARQINVTPAYAAQIYAGARTPSDRTISDICRVFRVNETWLRTGTGSPYRAKSRPEELAEIFEDLMVDETTKAKIVRSLAEMPEDFFEEALQMVQKFLEQYNKQ